MGKALHQMLKATIAVFVLVFSSWGVQAQSGIFESYAIINTGGGDIYYDLQATTVNADFDGANLGSFAQCTAILRLDGGQNKTFKCPGDDITNGTLWYRVYPTGSPSGSFISVNLPHAADLGTGCGGGDQVWEQAGANIDLLAGRAPGTYTLEVYTSANYTYNSGANNGTHTANNGGANYSATFTVTGGATCPVFVTASGGTAFATYTTLNAAFTAINAGTHQGVINITIGANTTEPAVAVPLLRSNAPSNYSSITIKPSGNVTVNSAAAPTASRGIIEFNGADNVTIDGDDPNTVGTRNLTFQAAAVTTTGVTVIRFASSASTDGAAFNTLKNCIIIGSRSAATSTVTTYGVYSGTSGTSTVTTSGQSDNNDNLTLENNEIRRCAYGIYCAGTSTNYMDNLIIRNNIIGSSTAADDVSTRGIYVQNTQAVTTPGASVAIIEGNDIRGTQSSSSTTAVNGIEIANGNAGLICRANKIHDVTHPNTGGYGAYGIHVTGSGNNSGITIVNNFIWDMKSTNWSTSISSSVSDLAVGIRVSAGATGMKIYHNSISISAANFAPTTAGYSGCIQLTTTGITGSDIRNNIFSMTQTGGTGSKYYCMIVPASFPFGTLDNNDYWVTGTNLVAYNGADRATLALWQAQTTKDANSVSVNPSFTSGADLHIPAATSTLLESGGATVGVTTDIDGDARPNGFAPDIGADEFSGTNPNICSGMPTAGSISSSPATICASGSAILTLNGASSGVGISYQWKEAMTPGGPYTIVGTNATTYTTGAINSPRYYVVDVTCATGPNTSTTAEFTLTVNPLPTVTVSPASGLICNPGGTAVSLTASGASTYTWTPATGLNMTTGATVSANPAATTTYTVTGTDGNGCQNTATVTVTVGIKPVISSISATPASICNGGNSQLNVVAGESVNTVSGGGLTINASGNASPYPSTIAVSGVPGTITNLKVTVTNLTHAFPVDIDMVLFGPTGAHSIIFTDAIGGSGGITNRTYTFQVGAPALPTSGFPASGTYGVAGSSYNGSGTPSAVTNTGLGVFNGTNPNGTWSLYVYDDASGDAGTIGSWSLEITTGAPVTTYSWTPATFLNNAAIANPLASNVTAQTTYTVTATAASGCFSTADVTVNLNTVPTATVSGGGTVCSSDPLPDVSFALTGTGPWDLTYNDGTNNVPVTGINASPYVITNAPAGTYTVVSVSDANCTGTGSGSATVAVTTATAWYQDSDGDTYGDPAVSQMACTQPVGYVADNTDCDDNAMAVNPGATEVCNNIDDDCDGMTDEGVQTTFYEDFDGDGFGDANSFTMDCAAPLGYVADDTDCNDFDALEKPGQVWYKDQDGDDYSDGTSLTQCLRPVGSYYAATELIATSGDCDDNNIGINPGAAEICDGIDNDCDGNLDVGTFATYYRDMDSDGFGDASMSQTACSPPVGYVLDNTDCDDNDALEKPGQVWYKDQDGDDYSDGTSLTQCLRPGGYYTAGELIATSGDCDDNNIGINPGAAEICNGIDDDCDSSTDEGVQTTYYLDADGDQYYTGSPTLACTSPGMGYVTVVIGGNDCNDANAAINPGAIEIVNSIDDNCNGMIDENGVAYYADNDGDGFGDPGNSILAGSQPVGYVLDNTDCNDNSAVEKPGQIWYKDTDGDNYAETGASTITACLRPIGYKAAIELTATTGDCNDNAADINPAATEICDGLDNNCNGSTDEGVQSTFYEDVDGDGYGDPNSFTMDCMAPIGYVSNDDDCDDTDDEINPGASETCDGIDNNCNGMSDEGLTYTTYYPDGDGDGYGITGLGQSLCANPGAGYTTQPGDCHDGNPDINPGEAEVCDGIDNNCNGMSDEGLIFITYYPDGDGDGYGITGLGQSLCANPGAGYTTQPGDCHDGNADINPGEAEVCDGIDNNCNGMIDEGVLTTYFQDLDGDGFGDPSVSTQSCMTPANYADNNLDCNDNDPLEKPGQTWYADLDNDGYSSGVTQVSCLRPGGYKVAAELTSASVDCNDNNMAINPAATEVCDGVDNDCDGSTDEGVLTTYYFDFDGDGFGNPSNTTQACSLPVGYVTNNTDCNDNSALEKPGQVWYKDTDNDGYAETGAATITQCLRPIGYKAATEMVATTGDCNDNNFAIKPGVAEICDGIDNNCNGSTDEGVLTTYYFDFDGDGFGNPSNTTQACSLPSGYVTNNTDCNDNNALEKPGQVWYKDTDNDGYGETGAATITQCLRPIGYKAATEMVATTGDCNDNNFAIKPGVAEICDGIDNNCNGSIDEGVLITYYRDMDGDGFGNPSNTTQACSLPGGYVTNNQDCNDNNALEKPGQTWYADLDNDGYGTGATLTQCLRPVGYKVATEMVATAGDCNDNNAAIKPGAAEICDGLDNNCNGQVDEPVAVSSPWSSVNIGSGANGGANQACSPGNLTTFNVSAEGYSTPTGDVTHTVYQQICGNTSITVRVAALSSGGWAGITMRESLASGSRMVALKTQLANTGIREARSATNGPKQTQIFPATLLHEWLRITRSGNTFVYAISPDGTNWQQVGVVNITMGSCLYVGMFAESINVNTTTTASFTNVSIGVGVAPLAGSPDETLAESIAKTPSLDNLKVSVYPNPSDGHMTLSVVGAPEQRLQLEVTDALGRIVRNIALPEGDVLTYPLDLDNQPAGVYYLRLRSENGVESVQRIVVQH